MAEEDKFDLRWRGKFNFAPLLATCRNYLQCVGFFSLGNSPRTTSPPCWELRIRRWTQSSLLPIELCALRGLPASEVLQISESSLLTQVLQDEKWVSMVKKRWHEPPAMMERSQRGLSSNPVSGGKKQRKSIFNCLQVDSFLCKWSLD